MTESGMPPEPSLETSPLWLRAAYFITGVALLFWLSVEDRTLGTPLFFAAWVAVLTGLRLWVRFRHSPCDNFWRRYPLTGSLLAGLVPSLAVLTTIFKSGLHAHGFLEFSVPELAAVLRLTPAFALGGLAMGLTVSFWCRQSYKKRK